MTMNSIRSRDPLSDDHIRRFAPSVFANDAHERTSDKYTYIPTIEIVNALRREGFQVHEAKQATTRLADRRNFTTHVLRMRHPDASIGMTRYGTPSERVEVVLKNSHDGSSSFELSQGLFRLVCSNGLVSGHTTAMIRVPHRGDIAGQVIEGAYSIVESSKELQESVSEWKSIQLAQPERLALAKAAASLRFADTPSPKYANDVERGLLRLRRSEDRDNDLWTTFNVIQENVIKGGVELGRNEKYRRVKSRAITGLDQDLKLNRSLWLMADAMAKMKTGKLSAEELLAEVA